MARLFYILILLTSVLLLAAACRPAAEKSRQVLVTASILPLGDMVGQIGGDRVNTNIIIPPGANPHTFEPAPGKIALLEKSDLLVVVGLGFEFWQEKFLGSSGNKKLRIITLADYAGPLIDDGAGDSCGGHNHVHDHNHVHSHKQGNPHFWTSPKTVKNFVPPLRDALIGADPAGEALYRENADRFAGRLDELDKAIADAVKEFPNKTFISQHAAWEYFARDYGLDAAGVIEPAPGKEPSPAYIKNLIDRAKKTGAKALFTEVQFSPTTAETVARESGMTIVRLDPLGSESDREYIPLMYKNLEKIKAVMEK